MYIQVGIDHAIGCTVFPFTVAPPTFVERILRDADILYPSMSGDPKIIMDGLRNEIQVSTGKEISYKEMTKGQITFMNNSRLFTSTGRDYWAMYSGKYMDKLIQFADENS